MKQFNLLIIFLILISYSSLKAEKLYACGENVYGQLGDGTTSERNYPVQIGSSKIWSNINCGLNHTSAIKSNGTLWAWGENTYGQLGDGSNTNRISPVQIGTGTNWFQVACGHYHTVAIKSNGQLWAWGRNSVGQLGDGTTTEEHYPIQIGSDNNWVSVACGSNHTVALKSDGTLWAWGLNSGGQLGDSTIYNRYYPIQIGTDKDWVKVACGSGHTLAIKNNGTLWAWGNNAGGNLGDGTAIQRTFQVQIGTSNNWVSVACGSSHTLAIKSDGTLWGWGANNWGNLGDGTDIDRYFPVKIGTDNNWFQVSCGSWHTSAIKSDGTLWGWGINLLGQLGDGTTTNRIFPVQIGTNTDWTQVAGGGYYTEAFVSSPCDSLSSFPKEINFGNCTCHGDTTISVTISNLTNSSISITQISFYRGSYSQLSISNGDAFTLAGYDTKQLSVNIKSTSTGIIFDTLFITYPSGCDTILKIPILGEKDTIDFISIPADTLYFGKTCPNVPLDTLIKVTNKSSKATFFMKNSNISPFSIIGTDPFSTIFAFKETKNLNLRFMNPDTGIFYQNLIITDTCGKTKKLILKAEIHVPQIDAGTDQTICFGDTIIIGNTAKVGSPPYKYRWYPPIGLMQTNESMIKASPAISTIYYLTVIDSIGCSAVDSIKISVNPSPKASINGAKFVCENSSYIYTTSTPDGTLSYWEISGAISVDSSRKDTLIIVWGKNRIGKLKLVQMFTSTGCKDSVIEDITITTVPNPDISGNTGVCSNSVQKYFISKKGFINKWYIIGGNCLGTPIGDTINVIWTDTSLAKIKLVQSNSSGCVDSLEMNIKVNPSPIVKLEKYITICVDSSYTLKPVVSSGKMPWTNIKWSPSSGLDNPNILNPIISNLSSGNYKYILSVIDVNGCIGTDTINVTVRPQPELILSKELLDFGSIDPCQSTKEDSLEIINTGTENIIIDKCSSNLGFSVVSPLIPFILMPNEKRTIIVRYSAVSIGQVSSNIVFSGTPCNWTKIIPCTANKSEMFLTSNVADVKFGQSLICSNFSKDTSFILTNSSSSEISLDFENIVLNAPFTLVSPKIKQKLHEKGTINVVVHYEPNNAGNYSEDIKIPFEAGTCKDTLKIALSGIIVEPKISSDNKNIVFPDISDCDNSRDTIITIQNTGTIDVTFSGFETSTVFSTTATNYIIPAGEKQDISIKFSPKTTGTYNGNLIIKFEPCGISDTINVSGNKQGVVFNVIDSLDFGEIVACNDISKTLQLKIDNLSSNGLTGFIKSLVNVSNPFSTTIKSGDSLFNGVPNLFDISANINSSMPDGEITGTLDFILSPCDSIKSVKLKVKKTSVTLTSPTVLNFGQVNIGASKIESIIIKNSGTADILISSIDNIIILFALINTIPILPATLKPNEELTARISYTPNDALNDTLNALIKAEPCKITKNIVLIGLTSTSSDTAVMQSGNKEGYPGDIIEVPIFLNNQIILQTAGITGLKTDLSFNSTILLPLDFVSQKMDETNSKITLDSLFLKNSVGDTLIKVRFKVGLGNADVCDLTLSNVETFGGSADISIQNGKFKLLGVCPEGGKRLINPNGKIQITSVKPNPAEDKIEVDLELLELSGYKLSIMNSNGQTVREISCTNNKIGINSINIDINDLASGVYSLILQTESERISKRFLILK